MQNKLSHLKQALAERDAILFVGAGVSMSVGLPSWDVLLDHMIDSLDLSREEVDLESVTHQTLAEYYRLKKGSIGPLRSWMDRRWNLSPETVRESELHRLIVQLDFPRIYTTNYDRNLELAYECYGIPYVRIANARDIAAAKDDMTQIVKFHGDFEDDASLVLAESDYFHRLSFDSPLDTKFRADALGRTIVFIGYSMTDVNIRLLLHRIWQTWANSGYEADRPKSYIFMPRPNEIQEAVLDRWGITLLSGDTEDPQAALVGFLRTLLEMKNSGE